MEPLAHPLWMLQRVTDFLASLDGEARSQAEELLRSIGAQQLLDFTMPVRLERRHFRLCVQGR